MGEEREAARTLKRHLADKAGLCIVDCVRIAREVAKSVPGEVRLFDKLYCNIIFKEGLA